MVNVVKTDNAYSNANGSASGHVTSPQASAPDEEGVATSNRGAWGNQFEFVLTIVGYAVGLGNVWRFPYLTFKNGGGAFLIPYVLMLILCGIPVFFFELCFGQFASLGPLKIWTVSPMFKGVGVALCGVSLMVALTYHVLLTYIIYYFIVSWVAIATGLPWASCTNDWNTPQCLIADQFANTTFLEGFLGENNLTLADIKTPSEEYFYRNVLQLTDGIEDSGAIVWHLALCLLLAWFVVFLILIKGIKSLGKVVYFTSTFPYVMMTVMVIRGATLDGAIQGIEFYLKPDFNSLTQATVWSDAASQIFYSLSCCTGGLIAMSSFNKFHNNVLRDSLMVPVINCLTSLYAGFAVFCVLGYMAKMKGLEVDQVAADGPGLVFVLYPEALANMPIAPLWSILFFFMMLTLGFSSAFSMVEGVFVALLDEFDDVLRVNPWRPIIFRAVGCTIFYLISLPMVTQGGFYLFNIIDTYAGGFPRLFTGLFEMVAVVWVYGLKRFSKDIEMMIGKKPNIYFKATWTCLSPAILVFIVVFRAVQSKPPTLFNGAYVYPAWADVLGWLSVTIIVIWIPIFILIRWFQDGWWQVMKRSAEELPSWGPALKENRTGPYAAAPSNHSQYGDEIAAQPIPMYDVSKSHVDTSNMDLRHKNIDPGYNDLGQDNVSFRF